MRKAIFLTIGATLVVLGAIIAPLPGPGGLPVVLIGTVVLLRHSPRLRRRWVKARRRWPTAIGPLDALLRRSRRRNRQAAET